MTRFVFSWFTAILLTQLLNAAYADTVKLAWDANTQSTLAGYRVYRSEQQGVYGSKPLNGSTLVTSTSWSDSSVRNNRTYYYVVRSVDTNAIESVNSNEISITVRTNKITLNDTLMPGVNLAADDGTFSESAVQMIQGGLVYVEVQGPVNTGITMANPYADTVSLDFTFTDATGTPLYSGKASIPPNGQITALLSDAPFAPPEEISLSAARTFAFSASAPLAMSAVRGFVNERSEFLMTPLPITEFNGMSGYPLLFPYNMTGAGWDTQIELVNPTDSVISGRITFSPAYDPANSPSDAAYEIAPYSGVALSVAGTGSESSVGSVRIFPAEGTPVPSGLLILSLHQDGVTVSQIGVFPESELFNDGL